LKDTNDSAVALITHRKKREKFLSYIAPKGKIFEGRYRLPGGKIKNEENYADILRRELLEEYDVHLEEITLLLEKPNVLGGRVFLCSGVINEEPRNIGDDGDPEWHTSDFLLSSNMVPNCKIAIWTHLNKYGTEELAEEIIILRNDRAFMETIKDEALDLFEVFR